MMTSSFLQRRRATVPFRLCLAILVSLALATGSMALNTQPVQAQLKVVGPCDEIIEVPACEVFEILLSYEGTSLDPAGGSHFYWVKFDPDQTGGILAVYVLGNVLKLCYDETHIGKTYDLTIYATELFPGSDTDPPATAVSEPCHVTVKVVAPTTSTPCPSAINPTVIPSAWQGLPWSMTLTLTGGMGPFVWKATGLPAGLTLDPDTGVISGTPTTCGPHTVKVTVYSWKTICCCWMIEREFVLFVDCWDNHLGNMVTSYYGCDTCSCCDTCSTPCDCMVEIGTGLEYGQTKVSVDSEYYATLKGGQSKAIASNPCQGRIVSVDQTVPGPDDKTRYIVIGSNYEPCTDIDNRAYFDYTKQVYIDTSSDPSGIAVPGTGWYTVDSDFTITAPNSVDSNDTRLTFREYSLPDGNTSPNRNLVFTVDKPGTVVAKYDKHFLLTLKSDYPFVNETLWKPEGTATWNLALQSVPTPDFCGLLGARYKAVNAKGSIELHEPTEVEILWKKDCTIPIILIIVLVIVVAGLVYYFGFWRRRQLARAAAKSAKRKQRRTPAKTSTSSRTKRKTK